MSDISARLSLPLLQPSQAQKHVTHNEALLILDALVQAGIAQFEAETPPAAASEGALYALGANPTGDWAGQGGDLALRAQEGWLFVTPAEGWHGWDLSDGGLRVWSGGAWEPVLPVLDNLNGIGVGTTHDATNRLAVAAPATLLTHDGAGHQLKINKAAGTDTATLLFQTGWTGHAEMGLAGDNDFAIKVSDGGSWTEALKIDAASGLVTGAAVQSSPTDTGAGRLMRADYGYGPGNLIGTVAQTGGVPTGAVIEQGSNANGSYTRWADGTQICVMRDFTINAAAAVICSEIWTYPASFAEVPDFIDITLSLQAGDWSDSTLRDNVSVCGTLGTPSVSAVNLGFYSSVGAITVSVSGCRCLAVGRWY